MSAEPTAYYKHMELRESEKKGIISHSSSYLTIQIFVRNDKRTRTYKSIGIVNMTNNKTINNRWKALLNEQKKTHIDRLNV